MGEERIIINLIVGLVFGAITSAIASSKGRNAVGWFFLGFFFGCISLIIIICLSNLKEEQAYRAAQEIEQRRLREQLRQEQMRSEALRQHTVARLDLHDQHLGIDTRQTAPALNPGFGPAPAPMLQSRPAQEQKEHPATGWYFCGADGIQTGPVSFTEIRERARLGHIQADTLVWVETMAEWQPARTVSGIFQI